MTREFGGDGNTMVTFAVDPGDDTAPLILLVGNSGWSLPDADDDGYQLEFSGNDAVWDDLAARTFTTEDGGGDPDGVISIGFAQDAIAPMLEDRRRRRRASPVAPGGHGRPGELRRQPRRGRQPRRMRQHPARFRRTGA